MALIAAATQRHLAAAGDRNDGRAGYWERGAGPALVLNAGEAINEQRRNSFAGGMVVPMVSSGHYKNKQENYKIWHMFNVCTDICKTIMVYSVQ